MAWTWIWAADLPTSPIVHGIYHTHTAEYSTLNLLKSD